MIRVATIFVSLSIKTLDLSAQCEAGFIQDCNGNCQPASWVGDGVCDDGVQFPSDFMCAEFNWDDGDCGDCPPGMVADCNGNCWAASLIGNGICQNGGLGGPDFSCEMFDFDGGDCAYPGCTDPLATNYNSDAEIDDGSCYYTLCPPGQFEDCSGNCWDNSLLEHLGNWHCNRGLWLSNATYFHHGPTELDFNCALFNFDDGDCITLGCTDPLANNYYEHADTDDGTCHYGACSPNTIDCMGNCVPENWIGENECDSVTNNPIEHLFNGAYPDHLIANIPVGESPRGMCILPDGSKAYIGCGSEITVVDLPQDFGCATTTSIDVNGLAYTCSASIDGSRVFITNHSTNQVQVINTATDVIIASIPVGDNPVKMWTAHNGEHVFVSCNIDDQVYMISTTALSVVHVFNTGEQPRNICTSPDDSRLYTADWLSFTMSVFSTSPPYELIATVPVDYWPQAIWATPDDKYVLVANFGFDFSYDHCSVIRTADWQVIARLQTGAGPEDMVSIGEDGQYLYVSNWGMPCCFYTAYDFCCSSSPPLGSATIIALPDFDDIVPPGTFPDTIPYINSTLAIVPLNAEYSFGMATHPSGEYVYTVNMNSSTMSVIGFENEESVLPGETCSNPIVLAALTDCIESSTACYTDHYNEACQFTEIGAADKVYSYTPNNSITGTFDMCTSSFDTKVYVYEDACGAYNSGTAIYCNDDYCGVNGWRSYIEEVTLSEGHTYYIVVDGFGSADQGDFQLCFDMACTTDLDHDGLVTFSDFLIFIAGYGIEYDTSTLLLMLADFGQICEP
ncbi:MAG: hypothetical protein ACKVOR_06755 [Flavobacteriales bacterium]